MRNLKELPKEIQDIIISSYKIGTWDGSTNANDPRDVLEYLQTNLEPIEINVSCELTLIDSVS